MKRQELKNLLRALKPDGDISDTVDAIMELNGTDIENAKKSAGTDSATLAAENEALKTQLKAFEKGGDKYVDPTEIERLKKFETDTKAAQKRTAAEAAVNEMLTRNKVNATVIKLTLKNLNVDDVKLDDKGKVTKEYEEGYMKAFKADYPEAIETPPDGTGAPAHGGSGNGSNGGAAPKATLENLLAERHGKK